MKATLGDVAPAVTPFLLLPFEIQFMPGRAVVGLLLLVPFKFGSIVGATTGSVLRRIRKRVRLHRRKKLNLPFLAVPEIKDATVSTVGHHAFQLPAHDVLDGVDHRRQRSGISRFGTAKITHDQ